MKYSRFYRAPILDASRGDGLSLDLGGLGRKSKAVSLLVHAVVVVVLGERLEPMGAQIARVASRAPGWQHRVLLPRTTVRPTLTNRKHCGASSLLRMRKRRKMRIP